MLYVNDIIRSKGITKKELAVLEKPNYVNLNKLAINFSDGFVTVTENIHPEVEKYLKAADKPIIQHNPETYIQDYATFYDTL